MERIRTIDVADAIRARISEALAVECTAGTTPTEFSFRSVHVTRVGGHRRDLVTDVATVSIDCRHLTSEVGADELSRDVDAVVHAAEGTMLGETSCYDVTTLAGPYQNPDPTNPALYRVSASYQVAVRMSTT
ncbi:hypothetical protein BW737_008920 [Actinomyces ruminis]|uniref:Tail terminator n=2 Tax=Actinomyces ruminis TaxID=1937003 RepID=A0ABX4MBR7_9ACTO|nr:hypothetical protein BW737_008920 [Actinomyces ruminis]